MCKSIFWYVFVAYSVVPKDKRNHCFSVSNLRQVFKKVKFYVRRSFPKISMTALILLQQLWPNALKRYMCFPHLSDIVWDWLWPRRGLLLRYTALLSCTQLCCKSILLGKRKFTYSECCMVNLLSWSLNEGQMN